MNNKKPPISRDCTVTRYKNGSMFSFTHPVVIEEPLEIRLDGEAFATLMRTPGLEKELIIGFCFTEGIIDGISDVLVLEHCGSMSEAGTHNVATVRLATPSKREEPARNIEVRTGCGICSRTKIDEVSSRISKIESELSIDIAVLSQLNGKMLDAQRLFNSSGATHAAALFTKEGELVVCAEDLGRHNALDKVIGHCIMHDIPTHDKVAILSGRSSFELVMKAARAGIPIIASVSAPTLFAVELSEKLGCTLIGFFRDEGFNIYTYPERVKVRV